jgi:hypothetical protein
VPSSAKFRRYAEVARRLAKQLQGAERFMWAQLAQQWDKVADQMAAKERAASKVTPNGGDVHLP